MENEGLLEPQTQKLIKTYTTMYKIVFQYSFFVIPVVLGLVAALFLQSKTVIAQKRIDHVFKQNTYTISNGFYTPSRVSDQVGPIFNGLGDIKILGGDLQATGEVLIGRNNIVSFNGIILPDQQYIIDFSFSGGINYFSSGYDVNKLIWVLNNWILSVPPRSASDSNKSSVINNTFFREDNINSPETNMEHILSILMERKYFTNINMGDFQTTQKDDTDLIGQYDLTCILNIKPYDGFCNKNIEYFIQNLPTIDLENKRDDIFSIAKALKKKEHIDGFCANIMYNVFKQPYPSSKLDTLMNGVCSEYNLRYSQIKDFLKVENQLMGIVSDEVINNNINANLFKLTSLRQKLIIHNKNNVFDTNTITSYLQFFNTLIHQDNIHIPQFYIDAGYYFNNIYLKNIVKAESASSTNSAVKNDVVTILDKINGINKGNDTIGIKGLEKMIQNPELTKLTVTKSDISILQLQNFQQAFTEYLRGYTEFGIDKLETDTTTRIARVLGTLRYKDEKGLQQESIIATFDYIDNRFVLSSVRLPNNSSLDKILISFLSHNRNITFSDALEFIKNNGDYTPTIITMCSILQGQKDIEVKSCSTNEAQIIIAKTPLVLTIKDDIVTNVATTNTKRSSYLQKYINTYSGIGIDSIISQLEKMQSTSTTTQPTEDISTVETARIAILGKFKQYLHLEPSALVQQNGKWIATFELQGYSFGTVVSIEKNYKLSPLVVQAGGKIISVPSFALSLIPFSQTLIDQFIRDPLGYVKNLDIDAYQQIQEALNPQKTGQ